MKKIKVRIINAFADNRSGGNPAGVVLDADKLQFNQKLEVARKVGLSETAFVSHSKSADFKLEFFTPTKQIPHCGHATIATFSFLKQLKMIKGDKSSKETIDGIRQIYFEGDLAFMEQGAPQYIPLDATDRMKSLMALGLSADDLQEAHDLAIVNTGNNFLIVPVKTENLLKFMKPNMSIIESVSAKYNLIAFYVYAPSGRADVTTRMFGPYYGIPEEAATGMAAGPLACYLDKHGELKGDKATIIQGHFMQIPSPSRIQVRLDKRNGEVLKLFAGGSAYVSREMEVILD